MELRVVPCLYNTASGYNVAVKVLCYTNKGVCDFVNPTGEKDALGANVMRFAQTYSGGDPAAAS